MWKAAIFVLGGFAAIIGGGFLYPECRHPLPPLFVCVDSEIPFDGFLEIRDILGRRVLIMRSPDGELTSFGTTCPHLGCTVHYRKEQKIFECPCHQAVFDSDGNPTSGPARRALSRYPITLRKGQVFIHFS